MKIEVLGPGCAKCDSLEALVRDVADRLGLTYTLEHVTDLQKIVSSGVMITPALVVDGEVRFSGRVPAEAELVQVLTTAAP